jgi:hypothetical protein
MTQNSSTRFFKPDTDSTTARDEWATYRQALRDFPSTWSPGPTAELPNPPGGE